MESIDDLETLLRSLSPSLDECEYVFGSLVGDDAPAIVRRLEPICTFREDEGVTVVADKSAAEREGIRTGTTFRRITLRVHSSLEAVGLTAVVAGALAKAGISANVVAAFHHDHVFVPSADAERALAVLHELQV